MALLALSLHGALYLVLKTEGDLRLRARAAAGRLWPFLAVATILAIPATVLARPDSLHNYHDHPIAFLSPIGVAISLASIVFAMRKRSELGAFVSSCVYLVAMLCGAAAGLYPVLLPSTNPAMSSISGAYTLRVGLVWWTIGTMLAIMYFCIVYWLFRGKVSQHADTYGH
jgi:cytochrome d ubiquinol oxidase subunit II